MRILPILIFSLILVGCSPKKSGGDSGGGGSDEETSTDSGAPAIITLKDGSGGNITSSNVGSYRVEGTCRHGGQQVTIKVGEFQPSEQPICTVQKFVISFELTRYDLPASMTLSIKHKKADGSEALAITKAITNTFICPANYVAVPPRVGYTDKAFCAMKYEAKDVSGKATSQVAGTPWVTISPTDALAKCQALGTDYDLITNDQWQTIGRNAEDVAVNWSSRTIGHAGGMNIGHSDGTPGNTLAASADDNSGCEGTGQACSTSLWDAQRRTHMLSNDRIIWDMGGNVTEYVKDRYENAATTFGATRKISQVTSTAPSNDITLTAGTVFRTRKARDHFGPATDRSHANTSPFAGLGVMAVLPGLSAAAVDDRTLTRGGYYNQAADNAGLFSALHGIALTFNTSSFVGFRCVYNP